MSRKLIITLVFITLLSIARGDYSCLCNYEVETPVYQTQNKQHITSYLYEFDCKAVYGTDGTTSNGSFQAIQFEKQVAYVQMNGPNIVIQTCAGDIPIDDLVVKPTVHTTHQHPSSHGHTTVPTTSTSTMATTTTSGITSTAPLMTSTPSTQNITTTTGTSTTLSTTPQSTTPSSTTTTITGTTTRISTTTTATTTIAQTTTTSHSTTVKPTTSTQFTTNTLPPTTTPHCHSGWFQYQGSCYLIHSDDRWTWDRANSYCLIHGAHLAIIQTSGEDSFIRQKLRDSIPHNGDIAETSIWLGASDSDAEGTWMWRDTVTHTDTPVSNGYTDWHHGEPDSGDGDKDEDCLSMVSKQNYEWHDLECSEELYFVCERSLVSATGMTTSAAAAVSATPIVSSTSVHTDVNVGPSTQRPSCHHGWLSYQDSCYLIHSDDRWNWDRANNYCGMHHAHLAIIESDGENSFITSKLHDNIPDSHHDTDSGVWLAGTDQDAEGTWVWRDSVNNVDKPVTNGYTHWYHNEPDSGDGDHDEDCMCMIGRKGFNWQDHRCSDHMFFICERSLYYRHPFTPIIG